MYKILQRPTNEPQSVWRLFYYVVTTDMFRPLVDICRLVTTNNTFTSIKCQNQYAVQFWLNSGLKEYRTDSLYNTYRKIESCCACSVVQWMMYIDNTFSELWAKSVSDDIHGTANQPGHVLGFEHIRRRHMAYQNGDCRQHLGSYGLPSLQSWSCTHRFSISPDPLKKQLAGKRFATHADMEQAVSSCLQTPDTDFFCEEIKALVPQWDKCWNVNGEHVEVSCVPSATICHLYIKAIPVQAWTGPEGFRRLTIQYFQAIGTWRW